MTHILVRAECRDNEKRVGITPLEAKNLLKMGIKISIEEMKLFIFLLMQARGIYIPRASLASLSL